jgi:hypothetical protein
LTNSTVANNLASGGSSGAGGSAPTATSSGSPLQVGKSGAAGAPGAGQGGGAYVAAGTVQVLNSILATNTAATSSNDLHGAFASQGNNLVGAGTGGTGFSGTGDQVGTNGNPINPLLSPLGSWGGPTQTLALLPGSPAIDAGTATGAPTTDQRGIARPQLGAVDIGAFESRGFVMSIVPGGSPQIATVGTGFFNPVTVQVTSNFGEPVVGGVVSFSGPTSGARATLSAATAVITDAGGNSGSSTDPATVEATAIGRAGSYVVTASAQGAAPIGFDLTNTTNTVDVWTGADHATSDNWSDPKNWSTQAVPGTGTIVVFTAGQAVVDTQSTVDQAFTVAGLIVTDSWGGTVVVNQAVAVTGDFTLASGTFGGSGAVSIAGSASQWSGGTLLLGTGGFTNTGTLAVVTGGSSVVLAGAGSFTDQGTVTESGTSNLSLNGTGTRGIVISITSTGAWDFQEETGINSVGAANGVLNNAGQLTLGPGGTVAVAAFSQLSTGTLSTQIGGTSSAPEVGTITTKSGTVKLAGHLAVTSTVTPAIGQSLTLLDNDGTGAVSGNFKGLPEGATITVNGMTFKISYLGGTGHDVVLSRTA